MTVIHNRIKSYLVTSKRLVKLSTVYHGTSSKFLRSILKHGLNQDLIKEGVWQNSDIEDHSISKKSHAGVYFSRNYNTAELYATSSAKKLGGNPLMILATIQDRTSLPDEDDYVWSSAVIVGKDTMPIQDNSFMAPYYYLLVIIKPDDKNAEIAVDNYVNYVVDSLARKRPTIRKELKNRHQITPFIEACKDLMLTTLVRTMFVDGITPTGKQKYDLLSAYNSFEPSTRIKDSKEILSYLEQYFPKDRSEAENNRRTALDRLIKLTKNTTHINSSSSIFDTTVGTLRIMEPVDFKGRNRISAIMEIEYIDKKETSSDTSYYYRLVRRYGDKQSFELLVRKFSNFHFGTHYFKNDKIILVY